MLRGQHTGRRLVLIVKAQVGMGSSPHVGIAQASGGVVGEPRLGVGPDPSSDGEVTRRATHRHVHQQKRPCQHGAAGVTLRDPRPGGENPHLLVGAAHVSTSMAGGAWRLRQAAWVWVGVMGRRHDMQRVHPACSCAEVWVCMQETGVGRGLC